MNTERTFGACVFCFRQIPVQVRHQTEASFDAPRSSDNKKSTPKTNATTSPPLPNCCFISLSVSMSFLNNDELICVNRSVFESVKNESHLLVRSLGFSLLKCMALETRKIFPHRNREIEKLRIEHKLSLEPSLPQHNN